ncbi:MAG: CPBP family intramembrane metalloprotease, partial [Betaproteobacteria bacterium]|nr:CPBP family intramembrane metalloprotease [Betaproteobacteria bacterium]
MFSAALPRRRSSQNEDIQISRCAVLFGLVHLGGGPWYIMLAIFAGLGYGYAYLRIQRVEASILVHFSVSTVHFMAPLIITFLRRISYRVSEMSFILGQVTFSRVISRLSRRFASLFTGFVSNL